MKERPYRMTARAEAAAATRERIIDAAVELFMAGPTDRLSLNEVARRSGVSVQTVIRRFGDKEGLLEAALERESARVGTQRGAVAPGDVRGAVRNLVQHYDELGPGVLRLLADEDRIAAARRITDHGRTLHRDWCARVFEPFLGTRRGAARRRLLAQLVAVCDVQTWNLLRRQAGLSRSQTELALTELLEPLLEALMARILGYTSPARGHLFPLTAILAELAGRGHTVAVRTLGAEVPLMRSLGFDAAPVAAAVEAIAGDDWQARNQRDGMLRAVRTFTARAAADAPDLAAAIEQERPDAVLVDVNCWGAMAAAERSGLPYAVFSPYPLPLPPPDAPPFGLGLPPPTTPLRRALSAVARPVVIGMYERAFLPPLNEIRASLGLAALGDAGDLYRRAPLLLHLTAEPFEYPRRDWPESVVLTGPCDWEPPGGPVDLDGPVVLVTTSSEFQDDDRLVRAALEGLRDEPVTVVATLPAGDPVVAPPPNARVERFVPHGPVLDLAVCAVTHGGMGATQKALARGVPVVVVPFGRDQFEVARRVEEARCGVRLSPRKLTPERLRDAVRVATTHAEGARRIAAAFAAAGGPVAAADAVESRLLVSV